MAFQAQRDPADVLAGIGRHWGWALAFGIITLVAGVLALALALLLGIFWIVNGLIEIFTALSARERSGRGWAMAGGLLAVLAGIVVLVYPSISLVSLAVVLGIWLIVYGAMGIVAAFQLRTVGHAAGRLAAAT